MATQWVKLEGHLPHDGLNPGQWYPVALIDSQTGMVTVECDELDDRFDIHESYVTVSDVAPTKATIYSPSTFDPKQAGQGVPMMKYEAVCPRGHRLGEVAPSTSEVFCAACGTTYEVELT